MATDKPRAGDELTEALNSAVCEALSDERWSLNMLTIEDDIRMAERAAEKRGREAGIADGRAQGLADGRAQGLADGQGRMQSLVAAMSAAGCDAGQIVDALGGSVDIESLCREYGVA